MFLVLRFALIPVLLFCLTIVSATLDKVSTNADQKANWRPMVATVTDSQDFGDVAAKFRGTPNTFPDPYGGLVYEAGGRTHGWRGRTRDVGLVEMKPGDRIEMFYDPQDPTRISTLVLLGRATGFSLAAGAVAFLLFYVWFFWLRPRRA